MRRAIAVFHDLLLGAFLGTLALTWAAGTAKVAFAQSGGCCNTSLSCSTGCEVGVPNCPDCNKCCLTN
jgi:hypothetical protein